MADGEANAVAKCLAALVVRNDVQHPAHQEHRACDHLQSGALFGHVHKDTAAYAKQIHGDHHDRLPSVLILHPSAVEWNDCLPARLPELPEHLPSADDRQDAHDKADYRTDSADGQNTAHQHSAELIHIKSSHQFFHFSLPRFSKNITKSGF